MNAVRSGCLWAVIVAASVLNALFGLLLPLVLSLFYWPVSGPLHDLMEVARTHGWPSFLPVLGGLAAFVVMENVALRRLCPAPDGKVVGWLMLAFALGFVVELAGVFVVSSGVPARWTLLTVLGLLIWAWGALLPLATGVALYSSGRSVSVGGLTLAALGVSVALTLWTGRLNGQRADVFWSQPGLDVYRSAPGHLIGGVAPVGTPREEVIQRLEGLGDVEFYFQSYEGRRGQTCAWPPRILSESVRVHVGLIQFLDYGISYDCEGRVISTIWYKP